jgi:phospholipid N-methyltransferase
MEPNGQAIGEQNPTIFPHRVYRWFPAESEAPSAELQSFLSIWNGVIVSHDPSNANVAEPALVETSLAQRGAKLADFALFFRKFLAKGRTISSAVPSSPALVEGVLRPIDFSKPATIVELGAGTGPVTQEILEQIRPHHRFVAVENDRDFCEVLRRRFPELTLLHADASRVGEPLAKMGIHKVDYVISGLPTPSLPPRAMIRLWRWLAESLSPNGLFIQITVAPVLFKGFYHRLFSNVDYRMVWLNVPPGGVYYCSRPRQHLRKSA